VKIDEVFKILEQEFMKYRTPVVEEVGGDYFRVLISAMLSARTRDEVTDKVCRKLFEKVKNFKDFEKLSLREIERLIYGVGFYKNKARYLKRLSKLKEVPNSFEELMKINGVGRKVANLVLSVGFGKDVVCVDTHVHRITNRWGFVKTKNVYETELELMKRLDRKYWKKINRLLVAYGQNVCKPVRPLCSECKIQSYCKRVGVKIIHYNYEKIKRLC